MQARQLRSGQAGGGARRPAGAAYAALAWVIVFFAMRIVPLDLRARTVPGGRR